MCSTYGVTRAGFYAWRARGQCARAKSDAVMTAHVQRAFRRAHGLYGSPRVTRQLHLGGIGVGRRRVARLMRLALLQGRCARLYRRSRVGQRAFYRGTPRSGSLTSRTCALLAAGVTSPPSWTATRGASSVGVSADTVMRH